MYRCISFDKIYTIAQFGAASERLMDATIHGNIKEGVQFVGQSQGLIHDSPTIKELIHRIVQEAHEATETTSRQFTKKTN